MPRRPITSTEVLIRLLIVTLIFALSPAPSGARIVDRIVAIVNDDCITLWELKEKAKEILARTRRPDHPIDQALLAQLLPQVIDQYLIKKEVEKRGIEVSEQEIDLAISDVLNANGITLEELKNMLEREGKGFEAYRDEIRTQIEHSMLISREVRGQIVVTDEEVEEHLKKHKMTQPLNSPVYVIEDLFIGYGDGISKDEAEARIKAIHDQLKKSGHPDDNRFKFQELGSITLSEMVPFLKEHVQDLKKGEISDIITTTQGFHIVRVKDIIRSDQDSIKAQRAEIRRRLMKEKLNARFKEWLKELRKKASIRILL